MGRGSCSTKVFHGEQISQSLRLFSIKAGSSQRLVVNPVSKTKAAVMDVQKVLLKPVS